MSTSKSVLTTLKPAEMKKWKDLATGEHLVESIDTVERTDNNELLVYFTL